MTLRWEQRTKKFKTCQCSFVWRRAPLHQSCAATGVALDSATAGQVPDHQHESQFNFFTHRLQSWPLLKPVQDCCADHYDCWIYMTFNCTGSLRHFISHAPTFLTRSLLTRFKRISLDVSSLSLPSLCPVLILLAACKGRAIQYQNTWSSRMYRVTIFVFNAWVFVLCHLNFNL